MTTQTPEQIADAALCAELTWPEETTPTFATLDEAVNAGAYDLTHTTVRSLLSRTIAAVLSSKATTVDAALHVQAVIGGDIFVRQDGLEAMVVADLGESSGSYIVAAMNQGDEVGTASATTTGWATGWDA